MKFTYRIEGMHCADCIDKIKRSLSSHFKILEVTLNPPSVSLEANQQPKISDINDELSKAGHYHVHPTFDQVYADDASKKGFVYYPIFLITAYILAVTFINNFNGQTINWHHWMNQFMAGFFLVFSAFKLLDLHGFANGYATYDLLAKRWFTYGYIYPFLELSLGLLYLTQAIPLFTDICTIIIMGFSSLGVMNSLLKKQKFQCACLGTVLKVPLSSITLIEDLTMVALAIISVILTISSYPTSNVVIPKL